MAVDRDLDATGVAEHDIEAVTPERHMLAVMQNAPDDEVPVRRGDLDVAGRANVGDRQRGGRDPMVRWSLFGLRTGRGRRRRRRGRRGGDHRSDRGWPGCCHRGSMRRLPVRNRVAKDDSAYCEQRDRRHGRHNTALSRWRLPVATVVLAVSTPRRGELAMSAGHAHIMPRQG